MINNLFQLNCFLFNNSFGKLNCFINFNNVKDYILKHNSLFLLIRLTLSYLYYLVFNYLIIFFQLKKASQTVILFSILTLVNIVSLNLNF